MIIFNKSLRADVRIRVSRRIVQIPISEPCIGAVVEEPSKVSKHNTVNPCITFLYPGEVSPGPPLKRFFNKPRADARIRVSRRTVQIPKAEPRIGADVEEPPKESNVLTAILIVVVRIVCR